MTEVVFDSEQPKSWIENLPLTVLLKIFEFCDLTSFRASQCCSRLLHAAGKDHIPFIRTELLEHQRKALRWMLWREKPGRKIKHLFKQFIATAWGTLEVNELTGTLVSKDPERCFDDISDGISEDPEKCIDDIRGGILADEPGLGKTATFLSLIMRTKGALPTPEGSKPSIRQDEDGHSVGWYELDNSPMTWNSSAKLALRANTKDHATGTTIASSSSTSQLKLAPPQEGMVEIPVKKRSKIQSDIDDKWVDVEEDSTSCEVKPGESWQCKMHPNASMRVCNIGNSESLNDAPVVQESGFVPAGSNLLFKDNYRHFDRVLLDYFCQACCAPNAISALCRFDPPDLHIGFTVPEDHRNPSNYGEIFKKLGLVQVNHRKRSLGFEASDNEHRWRIPETHRQLDLDLGALQAASWHWTENPDKRFFLSPATLIIVPFPLIEQWKNEISKHFKGKHMRVRVITKAKDYPKKDICDLPWSYDVVLTTFTHMSTFASKVLLEIHWLRVALDEGHLLGTCQDCAARRERINDLKAERRWIITGTLTPDLAHQSTVSHLYPLVQFLKIHPFKSERNEWDTAIQRPFEYGLPEGKRRLLALLNVLMIRTSKDEIRGLVKVKKQITVLDFEQEHAASYNELVENVQRNLMLTECKLVLADIGEEGQIKESPWRPSRPKSVSEMLRDVNLSCCVAGSSHLSVIVSQLADTLTKLAVRNDHSLEFLDGKPWWVPSQHPLREIERALRFGGHCSVCSDRVRLPIVTPCAHLLCGSCIKIDSEKCALCHKPYVMQLVTDTTRLSGNVGPQYPAPIEVIEWQPLYAQAGAIGGVEWHPNWRATQSSKCKQLVSRLNEIDVTNDSGKTKAIVFSRFWTHINLIDESLSEAEIPHCILKRDMEGKEKNEAVHDFRTNHDFNVLLMDTTGAVGLDLSMASYVFLMEPILDKSVEEQIISRAHRMGAKQDVHVEVMIMKGSVEEASMAYFDEKSEEHLIKKVESMEDNRAFQNAMICGLKRVHRS